MSISPDESDVRLGGQVVFVANVIVAVMGGLSLFMVVAAPFNMAMASWQNFPQVLLFSAIVGGFPLACATSLILSRLLFYRWGRRMTAAVVAVAPFLMWLAGVVLSE